jgi:hypothetical protein
MSKNFFELSQQFGDLINSLKSQVRWLEAANELQRKQLLEQDLEIARLHGRNQGLEMVARAIDNYPVGEYPELPPRFTAPLPPPRQVRAR